MPSSFRGADLLVRALKSAGAQRLFTLSGNQIMSVFDASIDADLDLIHVRHEAAAAHMADAWGRLTGEPGVALVTAGPGFANCLSALYVALMAEAPMILLSGRAPDDRTAFQDMNQSQMAAHVAKASWTVTDASEIGRDVARAFVLARSGRPGPVHLCLPVNLLEEHLSFQDCLVPAARDFEPNVRPLEDRFARAVLDTLLSAKRPLILCGPATMRSDCLARLEAATAVPVVAMESPRGVNDPSLGAFAEVMAQADVILLLGKKLDFTLRLQGKPAYSPDCRLLEVDSDEHVDGVPSDPAGAADAMIKLAAPSQNRVSEWLEEVRAAINYRPSEWVETVSEQESPLHPVAVCNAVDESLRGGNDSIFVCDGGEFGQWAQACISAPKRIINGPSGSIGGVIPFAIAARLAFPDSRIVAASGDGTFGFHGMEFDTAVRYELPFVATVGNDARWNAEHQIQLRRYGPERTIGCDLHATRYDRMVSAMGGHGEYVTRAEELAPALERARTSNQPACVNIAIDPVAAPIIRRPE
jgi:acetolactate synthase-1/2/3 large subunit